MAAHEHLSGQLSMWIPARELMNYTAGHTEGFSNDYLPLSESRSLTWLKLKESKTGSEYYTDAPKKKGKPSLYQSIKKEGVRIPVNLKIRKNNDVQIDDGHHRIVAAHDINPDMEIPVRYS